MAAIEREPLSKALLQRLETFSEQSSRLFSSLNGPSARTVLAELEETDVQLAALLALVPRYQANQARIRELSAQLRNFDQEYRNDVAEAYKMARDLEALVASGHKSQARSATSIPASQILNLARQLAPFTSAPVLSPAEKAAPGPIPLHERALRHPTAFPPFPPEDEIRRGALGFVGIQANQGGEQGFGSGQVKLAGDEPRTAGEHEQQGRYDVHDSSFAVFDPNKRKEMEAKEAADLEAAFDLDLNPDLDD